MKTSEASSKTVTYRNRALANLRNNISGGDSTVQLQSELRSLNKEERERVLKEANLPITIPPEHVLAMKADLALPWARMRDISRYNVITPIVQKISIAAIVDGCFHSMSSLVARGNNVVWRRILWEIT